MQPGGFGPPGGNGQPPGGYPGAPPPGGYNPYAQQQGAPQQPQYPGAPQQYPGMQQGAPQYPMAQPAGNPYGQAQKALAGAGSSMKMMKFGFIGIGALLVLLGIILVFAVDVVTGVSLAFTGVVMAGVALFVLPKFTGMLGDATAMVDGFAAKAQLAQTGVPANGRLLQVEQTGRLVNFNPEIRAMVEVQHPQLGVYQTQTTSVVPQIAIPRAQPGAQVQVRINPQNQHDIALVF